MPSRLATSLTVKLCGGNSFFNTASFLSDEYRVTHSSLALCSINDDLKRVTTSLTQGDSKGLSLNTQLTLSQAKLEHYSEEFLNGEDPSWITKRG
jgi:hypothetical protein